VPSQKADDLLTYSLKLMKPLYANQQSKLNSSRKSRSSSVRSQYGRKESSNSSRAQKVQERLQRLKNEVEVARLLSLPTLSGAFRPFSYNLIQEKDYIQFKVRGEDMIKQSKRKKKMRNQHTKKMDYILSIINGEFECLGDDDIMDNWTNQ